MDDEIKDNEEIKKENVQPNDEATSDNDIESGGDDAAASRILKEILLFSIFIIFTLTLSPSFNT